MADTTQAPINGTYATPHPYPTEPYVSHVAINNAANNNYHPVQSVTPTNVPVAPEAKNEIPKDEVGWFFVEQYYTTMSRSPEKLHLFYDKRSQFVSGNEAESVPIVVGQKAINEKIRDLDFHDCKVRVLNVDSQASFDNILVAVIGEISNRSEPSRKFAQTFVLAEQPNGYYVLNDIFRYLADEDEELVPEESTSQPEAPATVEDAPIAVVEPELEQVEAPAQADSDEAVAEIDEKLEEVVANGELEKEAESTPQVNGSVTEQEEPAVPVTPSVPVVPAEPEVLKPELPQTPEPTPSVSTPKEAAPIPEKEPAVPAKVVPKTWASIASTNRAAAAAAAAAASAPTPQAKAAAPAPAPAPAPATAPVQAQQQAQEQSAPVPTTAAPVETSSPSQPSSNDGAGWQMAGHDHNKKQSRAGEEQKVSAYIKNVNEKVDAALLKTTLARFGKLLYFDVNRQKNCAFVDFADQAGYSAAMAANPHHIGSEQIFVEERRIRPGNFGNAYGAGRGGATRGRSDGRTGSQGRGGTFQRESGRGGFASRGGRGGNVAAKGRSQPQAA